MIRVFYGEDRVRAKAEIDRILGENYEVIEGGELNANDLPSIFMGGSLFESKRKILVRDIFTNKEVADKLPEYVGTPHDVVLFEMKIDKRSNAYKQMKDAVEFKEFAMPRDANAGVVFDVYKVAKRDGKKAVEMLRKIENNQDPIMFVGLMATQAIRDYSTRQGVKEKRVLKGLAKLDMDLKSSKIAPWTLVEAFLLTMGK